MPQKTLETIITEKLEKALSPDMLAIIDESSKHVGHTGAISGKSTHFRIKIISKKFAGLTQIQCHRLVYQILEDELKSQIHALALTTLAKERS
ncbi:MAG TPA: BolA family protein [Candidatus Nitrosotenuis sp.]|jgi:BolA protein|nr:BolA family protein [Candidatus Nitrosotenuis sp.]